MRSWLANLRPGSLLAGFAVGVLLAVGTAAAQTAITHDNAKQRQAQGSASNGEVAKKKRQGVRRGPRGKRGKQGLPGPQGVPGQAAFGSLTYVHSQLETTEASGGDESWAKCPQGQRPIGGGVYTNSAGLQVSKSFPTDNDLGQVPAGIPDRWFGGVYQWDGGDGEQFAVWAVCAPAAQADVIEVQGGLQ